MATIVGLSGCADQPRPVTPAPTSYTPAWAQPPLPPSDPAALQQYKACAGAEAKKEVETDSALSRLTEQDIRQSYGYNPKDSAFSNAIRSRCVAAVGIAAQGLNKADLSEVPIRASVVAYEIGQQRIKDSAFRQNEAAYQAELKPYQDRYGECLKTHTQIIASANKEAADLVARAVLASCRTELHAQDAVSIKYHHHPEDPDFYDLLEARLQDGLILAVMQARAQAAQH